MFKKFCVSVSVILVLSLVSLNFAEEPVVVKSDSTYVEKDNKTRGEKIGIAFSSIAGAVLVFFSVIAIHKPFEN